MRVDVVTIFPDYLAPLRLSLPGRAQDSGLLEVAVHDLREWTHDRHRTVDDAPYGGGAGMVMRPEPWGEALDALLPAQPGAGAPRPTVVFPTPAGVRLTQDLAADLATRDHLLVACGRYEGIDQRVVEYAAGRAEVLEVSLGDYVLNGGEAAALVIVEAVSRLLPGFVGNPESLVEESHAAGLLEAPVYTRPPSWRGLSVPGVLLSGDHAAVAAWRRRESLRRTVARRPDLAHPSQALEAGEIRAATPADAGELLTLQRACCAGELAADREAVPEAVGAVIAETLDDVRSWTAEGVTLVLRRGGRLVGAVHGELRGRAWEIGRLMVAPDLQGQGLGRLLLARVEEAAPPEADGYAATGAHRGRGQRIYRRAGYRPAGMDAPGVLRLTRPRRI